MRHTAFAGLLLTLLLWAVGQAAAHEIRPGYLELREIAPTSFTVTWKVPVRGGAPLAINPVFPASCRDQTEPSTRPVTGARLQRWTLTCEDRLVQGEIAIRGLENTLTDVLVRIERADGGQLTERLTPDRTAFTLVPSAGTLDVAVTYLVLGVEHILLGIDHLLFVLALLLLVVGWRSLIATITAFTVAHSITLAAAVLGLVRVPQQPVEAVIALSILFLAVEIVHTRRGRIGLACRRPWLVAFVFGLLHGFGFAGALTEVGLPGHAIPVALLFFNVGVEVGQLLFVGAMIALHQAWQRAGLRPAAWVQALPVYVIGSLAAYWMVERVVGFWA